MGIYVQSSKFIEYLSAVFVDLLSKPGGFYHVKRLYAMIEFKFRVENTPTNTCMNIIKNYKIPPKSPNNSKKE